MMYELPAEVRAMIHNYLMSKPMVEVEKLVKALRELEPIAAESVEVDAAE